MSSTSVGAPGDTSEHFNSPTKAIPSAIVALFAECDIEAHLVGMNRHAADLHERTSTLVSNDH